MGDQKIQAASEPNGVTDDVHAYDRWQVRLTRPPLHIVLAMTDIQIRSL